MSDLRTKLLEILEYGNWPSQQEVDEAKEADLELITIQQAADAALEVLRQSTPDSDLVEAIESILEGAVDIEYDENQDGESYGKIIGLEDAAERIVKDWGQAVSYFSEKSDADDAAYKVVFDDREALKDELATLRTDYRKNLTLERDAKEAAQKGNEELIAEVTEFRKHMQIMDMLKGVFEMIQASHNEQQPMMTRLLVRIKDTPEIEKPVVSLWVCPGEGTPIDRIKELKEENTELREQLAKTANQLTDLIQGGLQEIDLNDLEWLQVVEEKMGGQHISAVQRQPLLCRHIPTGLQIQLKHHKSQLDDKYLIVDIIKFSIAKMNQPTDQ